MTAAPPSIITASDAYEAAAEAQTLDPDTFIAESIIGNDVTAKSKLCVGSTCVTEAQLQAMLANANHGAPAAPTEDGVERHSDDETGTDTRS
jgi:hypothetical protein